MRERATRAGATCIETRLIDGGKVVKRQAEAAAASLARRSMAAGLGVLRRNPDAKWKLTLSEVGRLAALQGEILESYSRMCKPGGVMVYATCSIMPEENEKQVAAFLSRNETWTLDEQRTLWPEPDGADGFYYARLERLSGPRV
ncbi:MAG: hypothetical protein HC902_10305 [Calothrix sp. SM1_5_4]|nr:hypothetical protein [Calothrix sp. SM1_5_4]